MVRELPSGGVCLDIGSNRGIYAHWMSWSVGRRGQVFAIEPQPEMAAWIREFTHRFRQSNVVVMECGASDADGTATLHRTKVGDGGASISSDATGADTIEVPIRTVDEIVTELELTRLDFVKIDVELHELEVLRGAAECIRRFKPSILLECFKDEAEDGRIFDLLTDFGYDGVFFHGGREISFRRFAEFPYRKPHEEHRNYLFRPTV